MKKNFSVYLSMVMLGQLETLDKMKIEAHTL